MAEPAGIFIEVNISEANVKKLLNTKFESAPFRKKIGYYFSSLLYGFDDFTVFIFNYDNKKQVLFIAYLLNHYSFEEIKPFKDILQVISNLKKPEVEDYATIASTFPDFIKGYEINSNTYLKISKDKFPKDKFNELCTKFWSFSDNNSFPDTEKALRKRNYFYKSFKNYYKRFLGFIELEEKPNKIANATKEHPYKLINDIYTYNNKVFQFRDYTNQIIELPEADPLTFGARGYYTDKNYLYKNRLAPNSPPKDLSGGKNNPKAIWEWYIVEGIHGGTFEYIKEKWDTLYYRDKNHIYLGLKKILEADRTSFEYLNFCFGRDKSNMFYKDQIIPVNTNKYQLNTKGFLWDDHHIFHYDFKIDLNATSFQVISYFRCDAWNKDCLTGLFLVKDINGYYYFDTETKEVIKVPVNMHAIFKDNFLWDKTIVFYKNTITNFDASSFEIIKKDRKRFSGKGVRDIFQLKDKNGSYTRVYKIT